MEMEKSFVNTGTFKGLVWFIALMVLVSAGSLVLNIPNHSDSVEIDSGVIATQVVNALNLNPETKVDSEAIANAVVEQLGTLDNDKLDAVYTEVTKEQRQEDKAEELVLEYLSEEDKDFRSFIMKVLNDNGENVEDRDDVLKGEVVIKDIEITVAGEDAEVMVEFTTRYYNDGDDEEEDMERARLELTLEVVDLVADDDYEDAEVNDIKKSDFNFIKVYD